MHSVFLFIWHIHTKKQKKQFKWEFLLFLLKSTSGFLFLFPIPNEILSITFTSLYQSLFLCQSLGLLPTLSWHPTLSLFQISFSFSFSFTTSFQLPHSTLNCFSLILLDFSFSHFPVNSFSMNSCSHLLYLSHSFSVFNSLLFIFILFTIVITSSLPLSLFHFYSCFLLLSSSPSYSSSALCHWYSPAAKIWGKFQSSVSIYNRHK